MAGHSGGEQATGPVRVLTLDETVALAELAYRGTELAQQQSDAQSGYVPRKSQEEATQAWEVDYPGV